MKRRSWRNEQRAPSRRASPRAVRALAWALALGLGAGVGALGGGALVAQTFPERAAKLRLAFVGNTHATAEELRAATGLAPGVRLDGLDLGAVRAGVAAHPWVASVRVATLPPDLLLVSVREREPVAVAQLGPETWLVDANGQAFVPAPPDTALPFLTGASARDAATLAEGVDWLEAIAAHGLAAPRAVQLADSDAARAPALELALTAPAPGARVLLGPASERDAKLARLAALLGSRLPELATTAEIDLRFGGDVILRPRPETPLAGEDSSTRLANRVKDGGPS